MKVIHICNICRGLSLGLWAEEAWLPVLKCHRRAVLKGTRDILIDVGTGKNRKSLVVWVLSSRGNKSSEVFVENVNKQELWFACWWFASADNQFGGSVVDHYLKSGSEPCHVFMPSVPALRMLRQECYWNWRQPGLHSETPKQTKMCGESGGGETVSAKLQKSLHPRREPISSHCEKIIPLRDGSLA